MSDASRIPRVELVDLVDDGMSDEEIAAHTEAWLDRVRSTPGVVVPESAAEALEACELGGELWAT